MTEVALNRNADMYLSAVRHELADLPWDHREDLLATVTERLGELPDDVKPWDDLGPSRDYARELRESAGLPPQHRTPLSLFRATRRRTKVIGIVIVVVLGLVFATLVEWPHYQPLSADSIGGAATAQPITDNLVTDTDFYRYEPGKLIVTSTQLHNRGRAAVTIDGVAIIGSPYGPLALRELRSTGDQLLIGQWKRGRKVSTVTVQPGKTVYLFIVMRIVRFPVGRGGGTIIDQPKLRVRVLGVHHLVTVVGDKIGILQR
jgi:hypothetical protein